MIPDAAIEVAHKAWREQAKQDGTIFEYNLRAALEAAAEIVAAEAWDEGYGQGKAVMVKLMSPTHFATEADNPYRE